MGLLPLGKIIMMIMIIIIIIIIKIMIIIIIPGRMTTDKGCNNTKKNNTEVDFFVHFSL